MSKVAQVDAVINIEVKSVKDAIKELSNLDAKLASLDTKITRGFNLKIDWSGVPTKQIEADLMELQSALDGLNLKFDPSSFGLDEALGKIGKISSKNLKKEMKEALNSVSDEVRKSLSNENIRGHFRESDDGSLRTAASYNRLAEQISATSQVIDEAKKKIADSQVLKSGFKDQKGIIGNYYKNLFTEAISNMESGGKKAYEVLKDYLSVDGLEKNFSEQELGGIKEFLSLIQSINKAIPENGRFGYSYLKDYITGVTKAVNILNKAELGNNKVLSSAIKQGAEDEEEILKRAGDIQQTINKLGKETDPNFEFKIGGLKNASDTIKTYKSQVEELITVKQALESVYDKGSANGYIDLEKVAGQIGKDGSVRLRIIPDNIPGFVAAVVKGVSEQPIPLKLDQQKILDDTEELIKERNVTITPTVSPNFVLNIPEAQVSKLVVTPEVSLEDINKAYKEGFKRVEKKADIGASFKEAFETPYKEIMQNNSNPNEWMLAYMSGMEYAAMSLRKKSIKREVKTPDGKKEMKTFARWFPNTGDGELQRARAIEKAATGYESTRDALQQFEDKYSDFGVLSLDRFSGELDDVIAKAKMAEALWEPSASMNRTVFDTVKPSMEDVIETYDRLGDTIIETQDKVSSIKDNIGNTFAESFSGVWDSVKDNKKFSDGFMSIFNFDEKTKGVKTHLQNLYKPFKQLFEANLDKTDLSNIFDNNENITKLLEGFEFPNLSAAATNVQKLKSIYDSFGELIDIKVFSDKSYKNNPFKSLAEEYVSSTSELEKAQKNFQYASRYIESKRNSEAYEAVKKEYQAEADKVDTEIQLHPKINAREFRETIRSALDNQKFPVSLDVDEKSFASIKQKFAEVFQDGKSPVIDDKVVDNVSAATSEIKDKEAPITVIFNVPEGASPISTEINKIKEDTQNIPVTFNVTDAEIARVSADINKIKEDAQAIPVAFNITWTEILKASKDINKIKKDAKSIPVNFDVKDEAVTNLIEKVGTLKNIPVTFLVTDKAIQGIIQDLQKLKDEKIPIDISIDDSIKKITEQLNNLSSGKGTGSKISEKVAEESAQDKQQQDKSTKSEHPIDTTFIPHADKVDTKIAEIKDSVKEIPITFNDDGSLKNIADQLNEIFGDSGLSSSIDTKELSGLTARREALQKEVEELKKVHAELQEQLKSSFSNISEISGKQREYKSLSKNPFWSEIKKVNKLIKSNPYLETYLKNEDMERPKDVQSTIDSLYSSITRLMNAQEELSKVSDHPGHYRMPGDGRWSSYILNSSDFDSFYESLSRVKSEGVKVRDFTSTMKDVFEVEKQIQAFDKITNSKIFTSSAYTNKTEELKSVEQQILNLTSGLKQGEGEVGRTLDITLKLNSEELDTKITTIKTDVEKIPVSLVPDSSINDISKQIKAIGSTPIVAEGTEGNPEAVSVPSGIPVKLNITNAGELDAIESKISSIKSSAEGIIVSFNVQGDKVDEVTAKLEGITDKQVIVTINAEYAELDTILNSIINLKDAFSIPVNFNVSQTGVDSITSTAQSVKDIQSKQTSIDFKVNQESVKNILTDLNNIGKKPVKISFNVTKTEITKIRKELNQIENKPIKVSFNVAKTEITKISDELKTIGKTPIPVTFKTTDKEINAVTSKLDKIKENEIPVNFQVTNEAIENVVNQLKAIEGQKIPINLDVSDSAKNIASSLRNILGEKIDEKRITDIFGTASPSISEAKSKMEELNQEYDKLFASFQRKGKRFSFDGIVNPIHKMLTELGSYKGELSSLLSPEKKKDFLTLKTDDEKDILGRMYAPLKRLFESGIPDDIKSQINNKLQLDGSIIKNLVPNIDQSLSDIEKLQVVYERLQKLFNKGTFTEGMWSSDLDTKTSKYIDQYDQLIKKREDIAYAQKYMKTSGAESADGLAMYNWDIKFNPDMSAIPPAIDGITSKEYPLKFYPEVSAISSKIEELSGQDNPLRFNADTSIQSISNNIESVLNGKTDLTGGVANIQQSLINADSPHLTVILDPNTELISEAIKNIESRKVSVSISYSKKSQENVEKLKATDLSGSLDAISSSYERYSDAVGKFAERVNTPIQEMTNSIKELASSLNSLDKITKPLETYRAGLKEKEEQEKEELTVPITNEALGNFKNAVYNSFGGGVDFQIDSTKKFHKIVLSYKDDVGELRKVALSVKDINSLLDGNNLISNFSDYIVEGEKNVVRGKITSLTEMSGELEETWQRISNLKPQEGMLSGSGILYIKEEESAYIEAFNQIVKAKEAFNTAMKDNDWTAAKTQYDEFMQSVLRLTHAMADEANLQVNSKGAYLGETSTLDTEEKRTQALYDYVQKRKELQKDISEIQTLENGDVSYRDATGNLIVLTTQIEKTKNSYAGLGNEIERVRAIQQSANGIPSEFSWINDLSDEVYTKESISSLKDWVSELEELKNKSSSAISNGEIEKAKEYAARIQDLEKAISKFQTSAYTKIDNKQGHYLGDATNEKDIKNAREELEKYITSLGVYKKVSDNADGSITFKDATGNLTTFKAKVVEATDAFGKLQHQIRAVETQTSLSVVKQLGGVTFDFAKQFTAIHLSMRYLFQYMRRFVSGAVSFVTSLDSKLTTINQTMAVTKGELNTIGTESIKMAKNLGTTVDNITGAIALYANATENAQSVLEKAKPTAMMANASGEDINTVADQIQGVVNQFDDMVGREYDVVNAYEKISASLAMDFKSGITTISEGVTAAGSLADDAGLRFQLFGSIVGKVAETTRLSGSQIGTAMKTMMARISRSKSADEDVSNEDRSKASAAFGSMGIDIYDKNGQLNDLEVTLDQLAEKWDTLTDAEKAYISEQAAGVRGLNIFRAMMDNYKEAKEIASSIDEYPNFANEVQEKQMQSLQAHLNTLKASIQEFYMALLDSGSLTGFIDLLSGLVNIFTTITKGFSAVGSILGGFGSQITALIPTLFLFEEALTVAFAIKTAENWSGVIQKLGQHYNKLGEIITNVAGKISSASKTIAGSKFSKTLMSTIGQGEKSVIGIPEGAAEGGTKVATEKAAETVTKGLTEGGAKVAAEEAGKTISDSVAKGIAEGGVKEVGETISDNVVKGVVEGGTKVAAEEAGEVISGGIAKGVVEGGVKEAVGEAERTISNYIGKSITEEEAHGLSDLIRARGGLTEEESHWLDEWLWLKGAGQKTPGNLISNNITKGITEGGAKEAAEEAGKVVSDNIAKGITEGGVKEAANEIQELMLPAVIEGGAKEAGETISDNIVEGIIEGGAKASTSSPTEFVIDWLFEGGVEEAAKEAGEGISNNIVDGIAEGGVKDVANEIQELMLPAVIEGGTKAAAEEAGEVISDNIAKGIAEGGIKEVGEEISEKITEGITEGGAKAAAETVGKAVSEGVAKGMTAGGAEAVTESVVVPFASSIPVWGAVAAAVGAFVAAIAMANFAVSKFTPTQEQLSKRMTKSVNAYKNAADSVKQLTEELETNQQKVKELEKKGSRTNAEDASLNKLRSDNRILKNRLRVAQNEEETKAITAARDTARLAQKKYSYSNEIAGHYADNGGFVDSGIRKTKKGEYKNSQGQLSFERTLFEYRKKSQELENVNAKSYEKNLNEYNKLQSQLVDMSSDFVTYNSQMQEAYDLITKKDEKIRSRDEKNIVKNYEDNVKAINKIMKEVDPETFYKDAFNTVSSAADEVGFSIEDLFKKAKDMDKVDFANMIRGYKNIEKAADIAGVSIDEFVDDIYNTIEKGDEWDAILEGNANSLSDLESEVSSYSDSLTKLAAATKAANENIGLTAENISDIESAFSSLDGYDADKLFENTTSGVRLNNEELAKLNKELRESQLSEYTNKIDTLTKQYSSLCNEIANTTVGTLKYNELLSQRDQLATQIEEAKQYKAQIEGLNSAYNRWQQAMSGSETGSKYDAIGDAYDDMKKLAKQGDYGTEKMRTYIELLTGKDMSDAGLDKLKKGWKDASKLEQKYFKDSKKGLDRFIDDLEAVGALDKDGNLFMDEDMLKKLQKRTKLSKEAIEELFQKGKEKGWEVNLDFGTSIKDDLQKGVKDAMDGKGGFNKELEKAFKGKNGDKLKDYVTKNLKSLKFDDTDSIDKSLDKLEKMREYLTDEKKGLGFEEDDSLVKSLDEAIEKAKELKASLAEGFKYDINGEGALDTLNNALADVKKNIEGLEDLDINFSKLGELDESGIDDYIKKIKDKLDSIRNEDGTINFEAEGAESLITILRTLYAQKEKLNKPLSLGINADKLDGDTKDAVKKLQALQDALAELESIKAEAELDPTIDTSKAEKAVKDAMESVKGDATAMAALDLDANVKISDTDLQAKVRALTVPDLTAKLNIDKSALTGLSATSTEISYHYSQVGDSPKTEFGTVAIPYTYKKEDEPETKYPSFNLGYKYIAQNKVKTTGFDPVHIKVYYDVQSSAKGQNQSKFRSRTGMSFAKGGEARAKGKMTLMGEQGEEMVVRDGERWFTVGHDGAMFFPLEPNDIVFSASQTRDLLTKGKTNGVGRWTGKAFAKGSAHAYEGSNIKKSGSSSTNKKTKKKSSKKKASSNSSKNNKKNNKKSKKKSSSSKKDATYFDWIERKIKSVQDALDELAAERDNIYNHWSTRNKDLSDELSKLKTQYDNQSQAATAYLKAANAVGLSSEYVKKIQSGNFSIQGIKDEKLIDKINKYQDYYDSYKKAQLEQKNLQKEIDENLAEQFDMIKTRYESMNQLIEDNNDLLEANRDLWEYLGVVNNGKDISYLNSQMDNNRKILSNLNEEYEQLKKKLSEIAKSEGGLNYINTTSEGYNNLKSDLNEVQKQIVETTKALSELSREKFDAIAENFEARLDYLEAQAGVIDNLMDLAEAQGFISSSKYYDPLIRISNETISRLEEEKKALEDSLTSAVLDETIQMYSKEWYDMLSTIQDVDDSIIEAQKDLADYNQEMKEVSWDRFEMVEDAVESLVDELEFMYDLLEDNDNLFDDNGAFTNEGLAALGTRVATYGVYTKQVEQYIEALKELDKQYENDSLNNYYLEKRRELVESQRDAIKNAQDEKDSIKDLIKDGYDKQLESLNKIIDARKKALSEEKESYEYQKDIAEKTKEVARYQRQLLAYSGDTSEEGRLNAQNARTSLREAQDDLRETQWDKYIEDTEKILDDLYDDVETWLNKRIDDTEAILQDAIEVVDANSDTIAETITAKADEVGYTITDELQAMLTDYTVTNYQNGVTSALTTIIDLISNLQSIADTKAKSSTSSSGTGGYIASQEQALAQQKEAQRAAAEAAAKAAAEAAKSSSSSSSTTSTSTTTTSTAPTWATVQDKAKKGLTLSGTKLKGVKFTTAEIAVLKAHKGKQISYANGKGGYFDATISGAGNLFYNSKGTVYKYNTSTGTVSIPVKYSKKDYKTLANKGKVKSISGTNIWQEYKEALHARGVKGYSQGGIVGSPQALLKLNGDNQFTVNTLKTGESVFDIATTKILQTFNKQAPALADLMNLAERITTLPQLALAGSGSNIDTLNVSIALPNVKNYDDFKNSLISDKKFNNAMFDAVNNALTGKGNSLAKNKWKK